MSSSNILDKLSLKGKVALVTGGAGPQYGRQITAALAEAGAQTYIASRNAQTCEQLARDHQKLGHDVLAAQFDQADEPSILRLRDHILENSGRIDVLVNNAVIHPMRDGHHADIERFDQSMHVNATGLYAICRAFGDAMTERNRGSIINISSIYGMVGPDPTNYIGTDMKFWQADYNFHKAGMIGLSKYFAAYYGPHGVRCNTIVPGGFYTGKHPEAFMRQYVARTYLGRMTEPDDIKGLIVLLASDASAYITAATIPVDGGYTAK